LGPQLSIALAFDLDVCVVPPFSNKWALTSYRMLDAYKDSNLGLL